MPPPVGTSATANGGRNVSVKERGFYRDFRPALNPEEWILDGLYIWPSPKNIPAQDTFNQKLHLPLPPVTLLPAPLHPEWVSSANDTGPFSRLKLDYFTQTPSGGWKEYPKDNAKDWVFYNLAKPTGGSPSSLVSKTEAPKNCGFVIDFKAYGPPHGRATIFSLTYGNDDPDLAFRLNINEDGKGYLARGDGTDPEDRLVEGYLVPNVLGTLYNRWHRIFVFPHSRNRILITSDAGGSILWEDKTLPRGPGLVTQANYVPPITQRAKWRIDSYTKMEVRPNILAFQGNPAGGSLVEGTATPKNRNLIGILTEVAGLAVRQDREYDLLSYPPGRTTGPPLTTSYTTHANPNGTTELKPKLTLQKKATAEEHKYETPQAFRMEMSQPATRQARAGATVDFTPDIIELSHTFDEGMLTGHVKIRNAHLYPQLRDRVNLQYEYREASGMHLLAVMVNPRWTVMGNQQFMEWDLQDERKHLDKVYLGDVNRLDGLALHDAVKLLCHNVGFPDDGSEWDIDAAPSFQVHEPDAAGVDHIVTKSVTVLSKGEADDAPTNLSDSIRSFSEWMDYLVDTYTSSPAYPFKWVWGSWPQLTDEGGDLEFRWKFHFKNPKNFGTTPVFDFFPTGTKAMSMGGRTFQTAYQSYYTEFTPELVEPEFNVLSVTGYDQGERERPITYIWRDKASIKGDTALEDRPTNWLGEERSLIYIDPALNTDEMVRAAGQRIFDRGRLAQLKIEIEAEWQPVITPWSLVRFYNYRQDGTTLEYRTMRVVKIDVGKTQLNDFDTRGYVQLRRCKYTLICAYNTRDGIEVA